MKVLKENKGKLLLFILVGMILFAAPAVFAQTQITISSSVPGSYPQTSGTGGPGSFVANFYQFALAIGGVLAFGVIVYGGIKYMTSAGNPSGESDAKEWIEAALLGLLLLVGVYFILSVINPQLLNLNLPSLVSVDLSSIGTPPNGGNNGNNGGTPPTSQACAELQTAGVSVSCSQLAGVQSSTIDALTDLTQECPGDSVSVTSVTGGAHSTSGGCTHANGYKADVAPSAALTSCIEGFTPDGTRSDGAALYLAPDGAIYANETTKPSNCGTPCNWTGAHWDIQACNVK